MNDAPANLPAIGSAMPTQASPKQESNDKGWSRTKWLTFIALILAAHVVFIFAFGEKKEIISRAVKNVPTLKLADNSDEWIALNDPTLFVLPSRGVSRPPSG